VSFNIQQQPYLRNQRQFPYEDIRSLANQVDHAYIDIANKVNDRTIGTYSVNYPAVTGEAWYLSGQTNRQQTLRQVYRFSAAGNIPHGINFATVTLITNETYGSFTDGTNFYGAIFASSTAIGGQVSFYLTTTNIVVVAGGGAPAITSGYIVLTWLSQF